MTKDILYSFRRCPYAIRARWALLNCGIKVELREVDLKNKPLDLLSKSKTKTVPLLIKKDSVIIEESLDIMLWALSESQNKDLINKYLRNFKEKEIFEIIKENDNDFKYHLDRFKYSSRFGGKEKENHFSQAKNYIEKWNNKLNSNKWLMGDHPTIADWCLWPFVRQFKIACENQKKTNYFGPSIKEWLNYFEEHRYFEKIMFKYDLWKMSSNKNYFPFN